MSSEYPLRWPTGWPRTEERHRQRSDFGQRVESSVSGYKTKGPITYQTAASNMYKELDRLKAKSIVLSSNLQVRFDGVPYSKQPKQQDPGIAVYFNLNGKEQCIPCDKWDRAEDNIRAIAKTIEALRGIERWGAKSMVEAAFRGFTALPPPEDYVPKRNPYEVLGVPNGLTDLDYITFKFRQKAKELHPDTGNGDENAMSELNEAYAEVKRQIERLK